MTSKLNPALMPPAGRLHASTSRADASDVTRRLRSGALWVVGSRVLGILVTLLINIETARHLSPSDFGSFTLFTSVIAFGGAVAGLGLNGAVLRFLPESLGSGDAAKAKRTVGWSLLLTLVGSVVVGGVTLIGWPWLTTRLDLPKNVHLEWIVAASMGALCLIQLMAESLRGLHRLPWATVLSGGQTGGLVSNIVFLISLALGGWLFGLDQQSALGLNLAAMLVVLPVGAVLLWRTTRQPALCPSPSPVAAAGVSLTPGTLLAVCIPLMCVQCITFFSGQADVWIAGAECPHDQLALYGAARRLMLVIVMPLQMLNYLVMPSIAELQVQGRTAELERILRRAATLFALPSLAGLLLVWLFGGAVLQMLFGVYYRQAVLPLTILSVGQIVLVWAGSAHCALLMTGQQNRALAINFISALALFVVGSWAARHFGIAGLAVASAAIISLEAIVMVILARYLLGVWTSVDPRYAWNFVATCIATRSVPGLRDLATPATASFGERAEGLHGE